MHKKLQMQNIVLPDHDKNFDHEKGIKEYNDQLVKINDFEERKEKAEKLFSDVLTAIVNSEKPKQLMHAQLFIDETGYPVDVQMTVGIRGLNNDDLKSLMDVFRENQGYGNESSDIVLCINEAPFSYGQDNYPDSHYESRR